MMAGNARSNPVGSLPASPPPARQPPDVRESGSYAPAFPGVHNMPAPATARTDDESDATYGIYNDPDESNTLSPSPPRGSRSPMLTGNNTSTVMQLTGNSKSSGSSGQGIFIPNTNKQKISNKYTNYNNTAGEEGSWNETTVEDAESDHVTDGEKLEGKHSMMPPGPRRGGPPPPPPPLPRGAGGHQTPMSSSRGSFHIPPMDASASGFRSAHGQFVPPGAKTPSMPPPATRGMPSASAWGIPPGMPPSGIPSVSPSGAVTPSGMPPVMPFGMQSDNILPRGQPPSYFAAPFRGPAPAHGQASQVGPYALAIPGRSQPPTPGGRIGIPLPPPPPREDDSAFVRRVRLIYMDRVMREHQKQDLGDLEAAGKPVPDWVFSVSAVIPYICVAILVGGLVLIVVIYALQFESWQETQWYSASGLGLCMVVFLLDVIRAVVITIVELRKFEIRKRSRAGDFIVRKVQRIGPDGKTQAAAVQPKTKPRATAAIPRVAPKFIDMNRPSFLTATTAPGPPPP